MGCGRCIVEILKVPSYVVFLSVPSIPKKDSSVKVCQRVKGRKFALFHTASMLLYSHTRQAMFYSTIFCSDTNVAPVCFGVSFNSDNY